MKAKQDTKELNVDFIQSKPLTEKEAKELSVFIKKIKEQNKKRSTKVL